MAYLFPDEAALLWLQCQPDAGPPEAEGVQGGPRLQQWEGRPGLEAEGGEEAEASVSDPRLTVLHQQLQPHQLHLRGL